ncbi:hypothetical protein DEV91_11372 [Phyllobacterium brassicacearum]|nr:hypothetical protein DEV91_11372 [Phyllobacterium brassicacearum]
MGDAFAACSSFQFSCHFIPAIAPRMSHRQTCEILNTEEINHSLTIQYELDVIND